MSASGKKPAALPATKKKSRAPMQLTFALTGDQRLTENLILEVRAAARRCGLEIPSIEVMRQPRVGPKAKLTSGRKSK
jgi:hypothetical protein